MIKHILGFETKFVFYLCFVAKYVIQLSMKIKGFEYNSSFYSCFIVKIAYAHKFKQHPSALIEGTPAGSPRGLVKRKIAPRRVSFKAKIAKMFNETLLSSLD